MTGRANSSPFATALVALAALAGPPAAAQLNPAAETLFNVRFGYTTFESVESAASDADSDLRAVTGYLRGVAGRLDGQPLPGGATALPVIELSLGNYYQIMSWLKQGELDAALVSSVTAHWLREHGVAFPIVELWQTAESGDAAEAPSGLVPYVYSRSHGAARHQPLRDYMEFLGETEQVAAGLVDGFEPRVESLYDVNFVSHLSSTGFLAPVACAARWLDQRLARHAWSNERRERVERQFWHTFFERTHFRFGHDQGLAGPASGDTIQLAFTFSGRFSGATALEPYSPATSCAAAAGGEVAPGALPPVPNDVVVISSRLIERLGYDAPQPGAWPEWPPGLSDLWLPPEGARALGGPEAVGFRGVAPVRRQSWAPFEAEILAPLLASRVLAPTLTAWYDEEQYPFSMAALVRLLMQDQKSSGISSAALVLPGGGVKSAYQSRLLDILYDEYIVNSGPEPAAGAAPPERLVIDHIVGTSGGAIVGFLAATNPPDAPPGSSRLADLWAGLQSSFEIFPFFNLLRLLSALVLVGIFYLALRARQMLRAERPLRIAGRRPAPLVASLLLVLATAPLAIARVLEHDEGLTLSGVGPVYLLTALVAHLGFSCAVEPRLVRGGLEKARIRRRLAGTLLGAGALGLLAWGALHLDRLIPGARHLDDSEIALILAWLFFAAAVALIVWAARGPGWITAARVREHGRSIGALAAFLVASYGLLFGVAILGHTPLLEVTGLFWLWLVISGAVTAVLFLLVFGQHVRLDPSLRSAFVFFGGVFLWWTICLGHALYDGATSRTFLAEIAEERAADRPPGAPILYANLVVTGSTFKESCGDGDAPLTPGDVYFCFDGPRGCPPVGAGRWFDGQSDDLEHMIDAVVASGSPVPVLPEHFVAVGKDCRAPLVDGGFAHNEPVEAARNLGARQVLVVRSQPDPDALRGTVVADGGLPFPSRLAANIAGIFPFLFERSQELDRSVGRSLVVAYLQPDPRHGAFPLLTDFREPVIERLLAAADADSHRLIGQVGSWGLPRPHEWIRPAAE